MVSMEAKITSGINLSSLPSSYIRPESERPKLSECDDIPVIDLSCEDRSILIKQIDDASQQYGFFQVINHGVPKAPDRLWLAREFLNLPMEEKMKMYSDDGMDSETMRLSTGFNAKTETSVNNWRDYLRLHCNPFEISGNLFPRSAFDINIDHSAHKLLDQYPLHHVPEVRIDIWRGNDGIDMIWKLGNGDIIDPLIYEAWKEYRDQLKNSKSDDDDSIKIMSGTFTAVAGQVVGGVMVNRLTSSAASSSAVHIVEFATVLGLSVTLVGITLRGKRKIRALSTLMIKTGAITTASAVIFSMGLHLPRVMAWTVGPVAFLVMAVAVALA